MIICGVLCLRRGLLITLGLLGSLVAAAALQFSVAACVTTSAIKLPCRAEQALVTVLELRSYDGPFLEDGSHRAVQGVAAVVVQNEGKSLLKTGAVKLRQGQELLVFSFSMLPAGQKLLVLEKTAKPYANRPITACWGWAVAGETDRRIRAQEAGRTAVSLTNEAETALEAWAYYKHYDPVRCMLVGGISYRVHVPCLKPGHRVTLPAYGYQSGSSMLIE